MKLFVVAFCLLFFDSATVLRADDMRKDFTMENAVDFSSGIYIAKVVSENTEIDKGKKDSPVSFNREYRQWIVSEIIFDTIGIKKNGKILIAEPYQQMEYERTRLYRETGIDEGLIENFYTSENREYAIIVNHPVIVFVIGNSPDDLVFSAVAARESVKSADKVKALLKKKKEKNVTETL